MKGFTLFETLLAMGIVSLVSVAAVYSLFLSLNLRDLTLATTKIEESLRVFDRSLRRSAVGASSITGSSNSLFLRSQNECWSFVYDAILKNIKYDKTSSPGCSPNQNPQSLFFPSTIKINTLTFVVVPLNTGGRQLNVSGVVEAILPFDSYQTSFANSYINLVDL